MQFSTARGTHALGSAEETDNHTCERTAGSRALAAAIMSRPAGVILRYVDTVLFDLLEIAEAPAARLASR
jgi:hypothetical protein